ncbi:YcnI family copper-binding membrane protein [Aquipuribacter sp. MA13-6]|uniref:YcnI family copper-binding membrane protein n=1 Tax=unclassified Aquipuribacter TaxID=2635084 RepID=UPI003EED7558
MPPSSRTVPARTVPARTARAGLAALLVGAVALATAPSASAHVGVSATSLEPGSYTVVTVSVPHGCEDSSTHTVTIQVPEQILSVTPTVNPSWEVEKVMVDLDEPVDDGHGGQYTERVGEVVYTTDTPLPSDLRDTFELSLKLPDAPGETLAFPTVQTCEVGTAAWVQLSEDPEAELDHPAPTLTLTDGAEAGEVEGAVAAEDAEVELASSSDDTEAVASDGSTGASTGLLAAALVLGGAGAVMGGVALSRSRARA